MEQLLFEYTQALNRWYGYRCISCKAHQLWSKLRRSRYHAFSYGKLRRKSLCGSIYPLFAPTVGALGAFIVGSSTISNMMLSQFQFEVANALNISGVIRRESTPGFPGSLPLRPEEASV